MKIPATWTERDVLTASALSSSSSSSSKQSPKKNKPQQCLRFAPTIEVVEIPNLFDYSREEIDATWFQSVDYQDFRANSYMTMGLYRAGIMPKNELEHSIRGLECRLVEVSREREWTRCHATAAVLNEQYRQYRLNYYSPQAIADLYHAVSWKSQYTAYTQAMLDEQEQQRLPLSIKKSRKSDTKNLLRKVINIERNTPDGGMDSSCGIHLLQPATDFDITSFFQELASVPAQ